MEEVASGCAAPAETAPPRISVESIRRRESVPARVTDLLIDRQLGSDHADSRMGSWNAGTSC